MVERQVVALEVVGSSPTIHPIGIFISVKMWGLLVEHLVLKSTAR